MKSILTGCCLFLYCVAFSQSINGKLVDSITRQPISLATIAVFNSHDTTLVTYRMSNADGNFRLLNLPKETPLSLIISYSGLRVYRHNFQLAAGEQNEIGVINMVHDAKDLDEVLVFAERPPVVIKHDTIEFNAAAFKTLPTALVEDLLKKLPGVIMDKDGNITVNGRKVNRLLVDGKDFFGSDLRMATRNLPANIIDKVQVAEDKDEAELNPDRPSTELGQVINLKLKKSIKKGWFGKAYAGNGTAGLHELGSIVNLFKDTLQLSLLGFNNNLDKAGFGITDIQTLGGYNRGGLDDYVINGRGVNVNGVSFGGQGEGINTTTGSGFNVNNVLKNGLTLNSQYFYGHSSNDIHEINKRQQFIGDTILTTDLKRDELAQTFNHRMGFGLKGEINPSTRFEFKPTLLFTRQDVESERFYTNSDNFHGLLNKSENNQQVKGDNFNYDHSLIFFKSFAKKGRSFNFSNTISFRMGSNDQANISDTYFYFPLQTDSMADQLRTRPARDANIALNANWNEPLTRKISLRMAYLLNAQNTKNDLSTFSKNNISGKYDELNAAFSNDAQRTSWRNQFSPALVFTGKNAGISAGVNLLSMDISNGFGAKIPEINQHYKYILPSVTIRLQRLSASYSMGVSPPSLTDMQPVPDNSNPLYIYNGNPDLQPTITNSIRMNYSNNIPQRSRYFRAGLVVNLRDNAVARTRIVRADGVQESTPVNVDGVINITSSFGWNKQYKLSSDVQFVYSVQSFINLDRNFIIVNGLRSPVKSASFFPELNANFNVRDKYELTAGYQNRFGKTWYASEAFTDQSFSTSTLSGEFIVRSIKHFVLETQVERKYTSQVSAGIQNTVVLWNAAITWLFLKNDKGLLKLSAYDLLKQNVNITRTAAENYIQDRQINMLTQYLLLTFTYNIRDFRQGKVGGKQKFFLF